MSEAELRETVLAAIVAAVQVNTERYRAGAAFDVDAIASFVVDEIEAAGWRLVPPGAGNAYTVGGEAWAHDGHEWAGWER